MHDTSKPTKQVVQPPKDPTAASRTWAIALITSAVFMLIAIGIVIWLFVVRGAGGADTTPAAPVDPSVGVKNVTFVLPADMPTTYIKSDQSKVGESVVFYDDEASMCSIMLGVLPVDTAMSLEEQVLHRIGTAYTQGVNITGRTVGERLIFKDVDGKHDYSFESVSTEQKVSVTGVDYTARQQTTAFKKFGNQVVLIGYGCKAETWAAKQTELATLIAGITIKTER